jgi:hypothetical protein
MMMPVGRLIVLKSVAKSDYVQGKWQVSSPLRHAHEKLRRIIILPALPSLRLRRPNWSSPIQSLK